MTLWSKGLNKIANFHFCLICRSVIKYFPVAEENKFTWRFIWIQIKNTSGGDFIEILQQDETILYFKSRMQKR